MLSRDFDPDCCARNPVLHGEEHVVSRRSQFRIRRRRHVHREGTVLIRFHGSRDFELEQSLAHGVRVGRERGAFHVHFEPPSSLPGCECDRERVAIADRGRRVRNRRPQVIVSATNSTTARGFNNQGTKLRFYLEKSLLREHESGRIAELAALLLNLKPETFTRCSE